MSAATRFGSRVIILCFFVGLTSVATGQGLQSEMVHKWDFRNADDVNMNAWPDEWKRRRDRQHPAYLQMSIVPRDAHADQVAKSAQQTLTSIWHAWETGKWDPNYFPEVTPPAVADFMDRYLLNNCLQIEMNGGAAELVAPKFPMDARFAYSMKGAARTENLFGHQARIELHLLDSDEKTIRVLETEPVGGQQEWKSVSTDIVSASDSDLRWGQVHVVVTPSDAMHFAGIAQFDDIKVYRLPRLNLSTALTRHIAKPGESFDVVCTALGIANPSSVINFELLDCEKRLLKRSSVPLHPLPTQGEIQHSEDATTEPDGLLADNHSPRDESGSNLASTPTPAPDLLPRRKSRLIAKSSSVFDGNAIWKLKLDEVGLYHVRVQLGAGVARYRQREILIAVMNDAPPFDAGPFGWNVPTFKANLQPETVADLVANFGAGIVKVPVWFDSTDTATADRLVAMSERLATLGTEVVGRLDLPPASQRNLLLEPDELPIAANIFRNAAAWEPLLEPVITRMGLRISWFQLGQDDDLSLMGHPTMDQLVLDVHNRLQSYSQELRLIINWDWLTSTTKRTDQPWNAVQYTAQPQLSAQELADYAASVAGGPETWVAIDPLPADRYPVLERVRDLTERMVAIKQSSIKAAFVARPFDSQQGLFEPDSSVGELLLPWRTLTSSIGAARPAGSIELPNGSINHVFADQNRGRMIVWNDSPTSEQLFLGDDVTATDLWGRPVQVESTKSVRGTIEQRLQVGPWPIVVDGVDLDMVLWCQRFRLEVTNLASQIGMGQSIPIHLENTFAQTALGTMTVNSQSLLGSERAELSLHLAAKRPRELEVPIAVRSDASAGKHQLRFDFDLNVGREVHFSVYRSLTLGLGDVEFEWESIRRSPSSITLRAELINNTGAPVSFDCKVFPTGQPYQRFQFLNAENGATTREVLLPIEEASAQELWIRCEQIGTGRVLNYRIKTDE